MMRITFGLTDGTDEGSWGPIEFQDIQSIIPASNPGYSKLTVKSLNHDFTAQKTRKDKLDFATFWIAKYLDSPGTLIVYYEEKNGIPFIVAKKHIVWARVTEKGKS